MQLGHTDPGGLKHNKDVLFSSYLLKSLSTSYSYFIHVSLYTKNSRKASAAMRVNAIRDTRERVPE